MLENNLYYISETETLQRTRLLRWNPCTSVSVFEIGGLYIHPVKILLQLFCVFSYILLFLEAH